MAVYLGESVNSDLKNTPYNAGQHLHKWWQRVGGCQGLVDGEKGKL